MDREDVQAKEQVFAKATCLDRRLQISVRRANQPKIHRHAPLRPDRHHRAFLQNPQEARLAFEGKFPDFIEE